MAIFKKKVSKSDSQHKLQFWSTIRGKMLLVFFLIFVLPLFIVGYVSYSDSKSVIEHQIYDLMEIISSHQKQSFETRFFNWENSLIAAQDFYNIQLNLPLLSEFLNDSNNSIFINATNMLDSQLRGFQRALRLQNVELVDSKGRIVYNSNPAYHKSEQGSYIKNNQGIFEQSKKEIFVSDVFKSNVDQDNLSIIIGGPVYGFFGEFIGGINFKIDLTQIFTEIQNSVLLGKTGETYFGKKIGNSVIFLSPLKYAPDAALTRVVKIGSSNAKGMQYAVQGIEGIGEYGADYRGKQVIASWKYIPLLDWGIVTKMDISEAFDQIYELKNKFIIFLVSAFLFVIISGIYISKYFVSPITQITFAAKKLAAGNFNARINFVRQDEFGELAKIFNNSIEALGKIDSERKELDSAKTHFLSVTSHELRSPMTPLKAQAEMLLNNYFGRLNHRQKEALRVISRNANRLDSIIVELLEISRIENARLQFKFVKANPKIEILREINEMSSFLPDKKIKIISKIGKLPIIEFDPERLKQVLRNLLSNAKKFSHNNSEIIVGAQLKGRYILFEVKDFGIGIRSESKKKIFEPFFRESQEKSKSKEVLTYPGTGLGLVICKGIIEAQNGMIWFKSEEGKGSTFYFTLPLKPVKVPVPITSVFHSELDFGAKIKELLIKYLGPFGELEFDEISLIGLNHKKIHAKIEKLLKDKIISKEAYSKIHEELHEIFHVTD